MDAQLIVILTVGSLIIYGMILWALQDILYEKHKKEFKSFSERDVVRYKRKRFARIIWPIYFPLFLVFGTLWLIFAGVRGTVRAIRELKIFTPLSKFDGKWGSGEIK